LFGIGGFELFLILLFGFLIFGPDKLPAIAKTVAQTISKFRNAQDEMNRVLKTEVYDPNSDEPFKNPLDVLAKVAGGDKAQEKTESFTERKDKYDKERAAKKLAEDRKKAGLAASVVSLDAKAAEEKAAIAAGKPVSDVHANKPDLKNLFEKETPSKPKLSADELYGNKPVAKPKAEAAQEADAAVVSDVQIPVRRTDLPEADEERPE